MKITLATLGALCVLSIVAASENSLYGQERGTVITVNDVGDSVDASPGDGICRDAAGKCTLRSAIQEANARHGTDSIVFDVPVPAVITLTLGELLITDQVGIFGRGARRLSVMRTSVPNTHSFRIFNIAARTHLTGMTIQNGHSFANGGGILASKRVNLKDLAITGNRAVFGGGIALQGDGLGSWTASIERCLVNGNIATGQGGGVYVVSGSGATIMSTTITNNSAQVGGGLANLGTIAMANATISGNNATVGASGARNHLGGMIYVINTIIGRDTSQVPLVEGEFDSMGDNIVTNTTGSSGWQSSDITSTNNSIDPMLAPLANNGGQIDSMALVPGSPAIDAGHYCVYFGGLGCGPLGYYFDLYFDQIGSRRLAGNAVDIGAYEYGSVQNSGVLAQRFYGGPKLAYSRVTVINIETLERQAYFVIPGDSTAPIPLNAAGHYVIDIRTKRAAGPALSWSLGFSEYY